MFKVLKVINEALESGQAIAVATIVRVEKSAPREVGAKMVVYPDGRIAGTIGGGPLEALVIEEALKALGEGMPRLVEYNLDPEEPHNIAMMCGGNVQVFIDVIAPQEELVILGGGHVGQKIASIAHAIGMPHVVVDDREEFASRSLFPHASKVIVTDFKDVFDAIRPTDKTFIVIVTRCHAWDIECLELSMKTDARYIGVIGSKNKTRKVIEILKKKGLDPLADPRVYAPIGLDLGDNSPGEIALSIMAEIVELKSGGKGAHLRFKPEA
jgi:xanthine dehydrogenase accessory factor